MSPGTGAIGSSGARLTEKRPTVVSLLVVTWKRPIVVDWLGGAGSKLSTTSNPESHRGRESLCSVLSGVERLEDEVHEEVVDEVESLKAVVGRSAEGSSAANDTWKSSERETEEKKTKHRQEA